MLLDPGTLDLLPRAADVVERGRRPALQARDAGRPARAVPPARRARVAEAIAALAAARRDLAAAAAIGLLAAAGVHPFAAPLGRLNDGERYRADRARVRRHRAAASSCARSRSTSRSAAPSARSPSTTRCARGCPRSPRSPPTRRSTPGATPGSPRSARRSASSCRARAIPPAIASWDAFADALRLGRGVRRGARRRGAGGGSCGRTRRYGTLEVRVPDAQATSRTPPPWPRSCTRSSRWLAARHDAGEPLATADTWRMEENRWSAARYGHGRRARPTSPRGERDPGARAASRRCSRSSRPSPRGSAAPRSWRGAGAWLRGQRRRAPARAAAAGGVRGAARLPRRRLRAAAPTTTVRSGKRASDDDSPEPRGRPRAALLAALREPPHALPPIPLPERGRPAGRRGPPARALLLLRAALPRAARRRRALGVVRRRCSPLRAALEERFERALRERGRAAEPAPRARARWTSRCARSPTPTTAPSLSRYMEREATRRPGARVPGPPLGLPAQGGRPALVGDPAPERPPKAALVEIQADEYGGGRPERIHAQLFADAMARAGPRRRATAPTSTTCPAATLATVNLMSLCGLHRRLRGAIVGHLALFEMTSSIPNRRYATGLRRLGFDGRGDAVLRRARRGRRRARGRRRRRPRRRARAAGAGARRRHPLGRERAGRGRGPLGRARCWAPGRAADARCAAARVARSPPRAASGPRRRSAR